MDRYAHASALHGISPLTGRDPPKAALGLASRPHAPFVAPTISTSRKIESLISSRGGARRTVVGGPPVDPDEVAAARGPLMLKANGAQGSVAVIPSNAAAVTPTSVRENASKSCRPYGKPLVKKLVLISTRTR